MIEETQLDIDISYMSDDEIYHVGEQFIAKLKNLIDEYRPYFRRHEEFMRLENHYKMLKKRLEAEERVVD